MKTLFFNMRDIKLDRRESTKLIIWEMLLFGKRRVFQLEKHYMSKVEALYDQRRSLQNHAGRNTSH